MLVELNVFSGRPNPRWKLDDLSSRELRQLENRLHATGEAPVDPPGLGYRGFVYADNAGRRLAYHGFVRKSRGIFADPSLSIERFLLDHIPAEFAPLRARILSELALLK